MSQNKNLLDKLHKAQITPNAWKRETELHKIGNIVRGRAILPCNEIYKKSNNNIDQKQRNMFVP